MHADCLPRRDRCAGARSCGATYAWTDQQRALGVCVYFGIAVGFAAFTTALLVFIHVTTWSYVAVGAAWSMWLIMSWQTIRDVAVRKMAVPVGSSSATQP